MSTLHLSSFEGFQKKAAALQGSVRQRVSDCINAVTSMRASHQQLEADKTGNWGLVLRNNTIVIYYQPVLSSGFTRYATRSALSRLCGCYCDLDWCEGVAEGFLCAAFYGWEEEPFNSMGLF